MVRFRRLFLPVLLGFVLWAPGGGRAEDNAAGLEKRYEQRAEAEKATRSRYRRLEWASLVIILAVGGGVILWATRKR